MFTKCLWYALHCFNRAEEQSNPKVQLIPLLLQSLDLPDANIRCNVIGTFLAVAEGETPSRSLVSEHSSTLVASMLKNSMVSEMPTTVCLIFL